MAAPFDAGPYQEIVLFLGTAAVVVPVFTRLRLSPVLGFIGAGALFGPFGMGRLAGQVPALRPFVIGGGEGVSHLAEFGVVFLLFTIGLERSVERLRTLRRLVFGLGAAQVLVSAAVLAGVGILLGLAPVAAGLGGIALALSSTAIVIPLLAGQRRLNSPTGRTSFSVLLFQDLAVAPLLFALAAAEGAETGSGLAAGLALALAQAIFAVGLIVLAGRVALRPLFHLVGETRSPELFMAACFLIVIGAALLAAASGLSMALGAFVAGLLLAETEYRRAIEAVVEPFKGLLLGVFFMSVGMGLDVSALMHEPGPLLLASLAVVVIKAAIVVGLACLFRLPARVGLEAGLLLGAGGEFAFVIVDAATTSRLLPEGAGQAILIVTTVSMIALPLLARIGRGLGKRIAASAAAGTTLELGPPTEVPGRVIVAGYGRVGQLVADMLGRHGIPWLALDGNPAVVGAARGAGQPVFYGDMTVPAILGRSGLATARALVITLDTAAAVRTIVEEARRARPDLTIVARARDDRHARELYRLGVNDAVPETVEASLQLSEAVLIDIGVATGPVIASIHERREEFRRAFQASAAHAAGSAPDGGPIPRERRKAGEFKARRTIGRRRTPN